VVGASETAKHVLRSMKANARLGFWNGSSAPYGYKAVVVEVRADAEGAVLLI
jgi:site-specific DNA recombinase